MQGISPAALDLRMALELNRLDMVGDSLLQVTNLERTRAVSLAQQETVALAQILKVIFCLNYSCTSKFIQYLG